MAWGLRIRCLAGLALLWAMPSAAQVQWGDLHAASSGWLKVLYNDSYGNFENDNHSMGFSGTGVISGDYYNPNFLSFNLLPYYDRSQANSESASITDASGYNGTANIFRGSHFPGVVSFNQTWNSSGSFGIPGVAGLTTDNNNHGVNVGWSALLPGLPTLTVDYGDSGGTSSLLGSSASTETTVHNFNVGSAYKVGGFYLTGGFLHLTDNVALNGIENGGSETANGSSNQYRVQAQHGIPYNNSGVSMAFSRTDYSSDNSLGLQDTGTTDNVSANATIKFPRLPVSLSANYTDNVFGSLETQLISSGQVGPVNFTSPESHLLTVEASTIYSVTHSLGIGGYVEHFQEYYGGLNIGVTQFGGNVNYAFGRSLKGLNIGIGAVDSATQNGNSRAGLIGHVTYGHAFGKWDLSAFALYDQDTETVLLTYTTSNLNYGGTLKRQITQNLRWMALANLSKSVFEERAGEASHGESFTTMLIWPKFSISGNYLQSNGTAILTATGLVTTPVPPVLIAPTNAIVYSGKSYGSNVTFHTTRHIWITGAWSRSFSNSVSPLLLANSGSTNYYGLATYEYRKLLFQAGVVKFNQSISSSGQPPAMLTSYSFGVSRWFKGF